MKELKFPAWTPRMPRWYPNIVPPDENWNRTSSTWMGLVTLKNPLDVWGYQEIIWTCKPNVIIETGTKFGGSARMLLQFMHLANIKDPRLITVDIDAKIGQGFQEMPGMRLVNGFSSVSDEAKHAVLAHLTDFKVERKTANRVMVILDSDHRAEHVRAELDIYAPLVTAGQYLIVEDAATGPGPWAASWDWFDSEGAKSFERDHTWEERFIDTSAPSGWFRRITG